MSSAETTASVSSAAVVADRVHLFGVRHHGPGSARSVRRALDGLRPSRVLIELPADAQPLLRWVGAGLQAPVAVLAWCRDRPTTAAFAPLASFSPEWQALLWAAEHDIEAQAIDLPFAVTLGASGDADARGGRADARADAPAAPVDPLAELAAAAGDREPERWWEDVVEHRGDGPPAFDAVAEAMAAVRAGWEPAGREARREAHMRRAIRAALKATDEPVAVVCGAWHVPALDVAATTASADAKLLRKLPTTKTSVAWVPWSHGRLAAESGYGAGVDSPGWYAHIFEHPGAGGVARFFVEAAQLLRSEGDDASPEHLISATRLADGLAAVRGRPRPGLDEVLDAAGAVFHRQGARDLVQRRLAVGDSVGAVPSAAPQAPLARDVAAQQRSARLPLRETARTIELDLRTPNGRRRSHLLHRLVALGVHWGQIEQGRASTGTFRETWSVAWQPEMSLQLVVASVHGTTLESAAVAALLERAAGSQSLSELVAVLDRALLADLPDAVGPCIDRLASVAALDPDVGRLMDIVGPLAEAARYGDVRRTDATALRELLDGLVVRIIAGARPALARLDDDAAALAVDRLSRVQAALALIEHPARGEEYLDLLAALAEDGATHGSVQGRATRLLHDAGAWDAAAVERRLARALSGGTPAATGAAFVEGFVAGAGTVLVHDGSLRDVIDRWVASLPADEFDRVVALLRRTFGAFQPAERRRLMMLLADAGDPLGIAVGDVDAQRAGDVIVTVRHLLGAPAVAGLARSVAS